MAGNEFESKARQRKALDLVAAAEQFVAKVAKQPDERVAVLSALIGHLWGDFGPERQAEDWEALTIVANRAGNIHHGPPSDTTKAMVLRMLDHQLHKEQRTTSPYRTGPFAGLRSVK